MAGLIRWSAAVALVVTLCSIQGTLSTITGVDPSICTNPTPAPNAPMLPNITDQFRTRIEMVIVNKNQTDILHEYFDATNNRAFVSQQTPLFLYDAWYDYNQNEFIGYLTEVPSSCKAEDMSTSDHRFLFGYENVNGKPTEFSGAKALHFKAQDINQIYMGRTTIRGKIVDHWQSCQFWKSQSAAMKVDWYFTVRGSWDSAYGLSVVPVLAHVQGRVDNGTNPHNFEHYYNFYQWYPSIDAHDSSRFETPAGVQCVNRMLTKPFPKVPQDAFSVTVESIDEFKSSISYMKETFYVSQKLVKYEHRPNKGTSQFGTNYLMEVHDFHTGVAYVTDTTHGNCTARPIESFDFDDKYVVDSNVVRMRTAKEFFYFDNAVQASYEGKKLNRNINCFTWIAKRTDFPTLNPGNTTWEWYFADDSWKEINAGPEAGAIPVQMRLAMPSRNWNFEYNLYNFKKSRPDLLTFDISACYEFAKRRKFQFMFKVDSATKQTISNNVEVFKYFVLQAVMTATKLPPLRVSNLQAFFADNIIISLELLDVAPTNIGDVKRDPTFTETNLDFAANTLTQLIQNKQFQVKLSGTDFPNVAPLPAIPNSVIQVSYVNSTTTVNNVNQSGYGAGPMAAVGITMPILGGGLGVLFAYFFFK